MNATIVELSSSISEQYYNFINEFVDSDFEDEKALGKFYTNIDVAEKMISEVLSHLHAPSTTSVIKVIDPFCGDGRLIEIFLQQASQVSSLAKCEFELTLWDIDANALQNAAQSIEKTADALNMNVDICAQNGDAYVVFEKKVSGFDVCVTNPPWCLLKPQKLFNSRCSADEIEDYKNAISLYDDYMRSKFAISQPTKKFGRWGTNLARCGVEVAIRLLNSTGICGFVSPASLFNDQVSVPLRKWLFEEHKIYSLSYFPAELKLFGLADVSSVTAVVGGGVTDSSFITRTYSADFQATERELGESRYNYISRHDYALPLEIGFDSLEIQASFDAFPSVQEYCISNGLQFTRELDETRVSEKLASKGKTVFAKGYMIDRYSFSPDDMYLNEDIVTPPESTRHSKIVWRDVSRSSQKRRLKGTILGPGHIAGNSLGIIYSEQDKTCELKYLLGIMNSMVFELQARSRIVSNHVPAGIIKQIRIPAFSKESKLLKAVDTALIHPESEWAIEPIVATLYGLTKEQFKVIAQNFTLTAEEKHLLSDAIEETFSDMDIKRI